MIREFLENIKNGLLDDKIMLEKQLVEKENRMKEIDQFVELLEEKSDPNFESFTPRDVNIRNKDKIKLLLDEKKKIRRELGSSKKKLDENKIDLNKINEIIIYEREREDRISIEKEHAEQARLEGLEVLQYVLHEKNSLADIMKNELMEDIQNLYRKMKLGVQLIDVDINRSKLELRQLLPDFEKIINHTEMRINEIYISTENRNLGALFSGYINVQANKYKKKIKYVSHEIIDCDESKITFIYQIVKELLDKVILKVNTLELSAIVKDEKLIIDIACEFDCKEGLERCLSRIKENKKLYTEIRLLQARLNYEKHGDTQLTFKITF